MSKRATRPEGVAIIASATLFAAVAFLAILGVLLMADHAPLGFMAVLGAVVVAGLGGVLK